MGLPVGVEWSTDDDACPSALPFRAYALICNEFFRDQNLSDPLNIPTGDADQQGTNGDSYIDDVPNGGKPFKVAKFHDLFSSCLPSPQKGEPVRLNYGSNAPVYSFVDRVPFEPWFSGDKARLVINPQISSVTEESGSYGNYHSYLTASANTFDVVASRNTDVSISAISDNLPTNSNSIIPENLWADLSQVNAITVNELRLAFQLQRYYEHLASGGSRYIEWCKEFFGAVSSDARLQRPEYLGGNRVPINISEVLNTSQSKDDFLGDTGAMSATADIHDDFVKSFTEHGIILGLMCVRYDHSYSQGISRDWTRRTLMDQYNPTFAHLGEMPVYTYEIYADGNMNNKDVFGYNEAWSSYRYKPDQVSGEMRPGITNSLASWHLGDYYTEAPTLSDDWIREDLTNVDRVISVTSQVANQFWCDIYVKNIATRVMPMYSVPGLIDHF